MDLSQLMQIYTDYELALGQACKRSSIFAGIFGQGSLNDPRSAPCNQEFLEKTEAWVTSFATSDPKEETAEKACHWILDAAKNHQNRPEYWHYLVAQGYLKTLIPILSPECSERLASDFNKQYPRRIRLPIQEEVYCLLMAQFK